MDRLLQMAKQGRSVKDLQRCFARDVIGPLRRHRPEPAGVIDPSDLACVLDKLARQASALRSARPEGRLMESLVQSLVSALGGARMRSEDFDALLAGLGRQVPLEEAAAWRGLSHRVLDALAVAGAGNKPIAETLGSRLARAVVRCEPHWGQANPARYSRFLVHHLAPRVDFSRSASLRSVLGALVRATGDGHSRDMEALARIARGAVDLAVQKSRSHAELRMNTAVALSELLVVLGTSPGPEALRAVLAGAGTAVRCHDAKAPAEAKHMLRGIFEAITNAASGDDDALAAMAAGLAAAAPSASAIDRCGADVAAEVRNLKGCASREEITRRLRRIGHVHSMIRSRLPEAPAAGTLAPSSTNFARVAVGEPAWIDLRILCRLGCKPMETEPVIAWARRVRDKLDALCAASPGQMVALFRAFSHAAVAEGVPPEHVGVLAQALVHSAAARSAGDDVLAEAAAAFIEAQALHPQVQAATARAAGGLLQSMAACGRRVGAIARRAGEMLPPATFSHAARGMAAAVAQLSPATALEWDRQWGDAATPGPGPLPGTLPRSDPWRDLFDLSRVRPVEPPPRSVARR